MTKAAFVLLFAFFFCLPARAKACDASTPCPQGKVCFENECVADCRETQIPCETGKICQTTTGLCAEGCLVSQDCQAGEICQNAKCVKLCNGNVTLGGTVCDGETPECYESADGLSGYCGCREGSCAPGSVCSGTKCAVCPRGYENYQDQNCRCPAGYASDGKGGCAVCGERQDCNCPASFVTNGKGTCVACVESDDCGESGNKCVNGGTLDAKCVDLKCSERTYMKGNACLPCSEGCLTCKDGNACLQCDATYYADGKACKSCEKRFGEGCGVCHVDSWQCEECQLGYVKQADGKCKKVVCRADEYVAGDQCVKCSDMIEHCYKCTDEPICQICSGEGRVVQDGLCVCDEAWEENEKGACVKKKCETGFYNNGAKCVRCPKGCFECMDEYQCLYCNDADGYTGENGLCRKVKCSSGQYRNGVSCRECGEKIANCAECSELGTTCKRCDTGFKLSEDSAGCLPIQCDAGFYLDGNDCKPCADKFPNCAACTADGCSDCAKYYEISGNYCVPKVCKGAKEYLDLDSGKCEVCSVGFEAVENGCMPKFCPEGQYLNGDDCAPCPENCRRCENGESCRICDNGFGLKDGGKQCVECGDGYFLKGTRCVRCEETLPYCKECTSDGTVCLDCGNARMTVLRKCIL